MSKLKNITIRLPKESPAYEIIAKCVAEEGNSWSGVALRFLTTSVENVVAHKKHAATIKRQIHTIKDLTNKQREWAVEEDRVSSEINKLKSDLAQAQQKAEEAEVMAESWRKLCVALMQHLGGMQ